MYTTSPWYIYITYLSSLLKTLLFLHWSMYTAWLWSLILDPCYTKPLKFRSESDPNFKLHSSSPSKVCYLKSTSTPVVPSKGPDSRHSFVITGHEIGFPKPMPKPKPKPKPFPKRTLNLSLQPKPVPKPNSKLTPKPIPTPKPKPIPKSKSVPTSKPILTSLTLSP